MANSCSSRSSCWACLLQQDAHEFFTALLEEVQGEVLLAEVSTQGVVHGRGLHSIVRNSTWTQRV
jgi:hypothetical protein